MVEEIYVKHPAVNDGAETRLVDVEMTDIHELSPTPGGVDPVGDIQMIAVPDRATVHFAESIRRGRHHSNVPRVSQMG